LVQTADGGYAWAGTTYSSNYYDVWFVKTDSAGTMQWSRTYKGTIGTSFDKAYSLIKTVDGGYALAGYTSSWLGAGGDDFWLIKTDASGNNPWDRTFGTKGDEIARSMVQTTDGGYALAGYIKYFGIDDYDFFLVKTDAAGNLQWNRTYGGASYDHAYSLVQTDDGGYALAGDTSSYGAGYYDFWLVKTDSAGNPQWNRTYGGAGTDSASSVVKTSDGYAFAGTSNYDFWLVKTDSAGNMLWNRTYGGASYNYAYSLVQTDDEGYALAGNTCPYGGTDWDLFLVKTDSAGNLQWSRTYGAGVDCAYSLVQTADGGYALAGFTQPAGSLEDVWLVKTDTESGLAWKSLTNNSITLYRGLTDPYWNYVRVRIWLIKEPSWIYGDINMDGIVDAKDLYILSRNYGKTFSLLSLTGIIAIASIHTVKKRKKQNK